jgi:hypothetical protein
MAHVGLPQSIPRSAHPVRGSTKWRACISGVEFGPRLVQYTGSRHQSAVGGVERQSGGAGRPLPTSSCYSIESLSCIDDLAEAYRPLLIEHQLLVPFRNADAPCRTPIQNAASSNPTLLSRFQANLPAALTMDCGFTDALPLVGPSWKD